MKSGSGVAGWRERQWEGCWGTGHGLCTNFVFWHFDACCY